MKKFLLLLSVVAFAFTGCYDDMGPQEPDVNEITLDSTFVQVPCDSTGPYSIGITSDYAWKASTSDSWITVISEFGNPGSAFLNFNVTVNHGAARTGHITVFSDDYNLSAELTVYQSAGSFVEEFDIEVTDITPSSAHIKVAAKESNRTFYVGLMTFASFNEYASTAEFMNERFALLAEYVGAGYTWSEFLDTGVAEWTTSQVAPSTEYVVYAFGIDLRGNLTSADLTYAKFTTPESTFNTASWSGWWEVTSPKTYTQQNNAISGNYEESWTNSKLTRPIEIVDGASLDASLEGYAVVYGWDGYFLYNSPAIGVYNDNKIELLNEEIVYEDAEEGLVYQWLAQSDIPAMGGVYLVGGEYAPYTFVMDANGNVNINAYIGQITTGDEFAVCAFNIWPVKGEDIFVWNYVEPVLTFSGEQMTAVKTTAPSRVPAKLSTKKNVRIMHKYAHPKAAAAQFSSAIKLAK